jgi:Outer membrane protein beta-barrel domain
MAILAFARPAAAQWQLAPFIGLTLGGSTTFNDPENAATGRKFARRHAVFGASMTRMWRGPVGLEGLFLYVPGIFDRDDLTEVTSSRTLAAMANVVVTIPRSWSEHGLRPFVSGGFGLLHVAQQDPLDLFPIRRNVLGYDVGGGAVGFITDRTGVRFDLRRFSYVRSAEPTGVSFDRETMNYWTATVGVVFRY